MDFSSNLGLIDLLLLCFLKIGLGPESFPGLEEFLLRVMFDKVFVFSFVPPVDGRLVVLAMVLGEGFGVHAAFGLAKLHLIEHDDLILALSL